MTAENLQSAIESAVIDRRYRGNVLLVIRLLELIAIVAHFERAVSLSHDFDRIPFVIGCRRVRYVLLWNVVIFAAFVRVVQLPQIFEAWRILDRSPGLDLAT